ncbi:hypothetical protein CHU92_12080 [Flavobacterium cyanobacteriorum]|uniref:Prenyltransferase n=1 Tax=Flavobacterium cyanobacteriorum TaxID=2022802 RepID=A0A255YY09_9FLAO|nr:hypothetical protein [Flavobacterium cyanobacteriorum]OYQ34068.1 hypothetical protein CHU92_12080 [Flavobacterium cyanobacteriorum]
MKILKLFRPQNLALLAFAQLVFRYGFLEQQPGLLLALNHWQYALLVLSCVLIAAGGSLMEAISGSEKYSGGLSEARGYNIYMIINFAAIGIGYYIASFIGRPGFVAVFLIAAALLFISATNLRQVMLLSNVLTAITAGMSIIIISIFNFYPFLVMENRQYFQTMFRLTIDFSIFITLLVLIYTLLIDLYNTDKDYNTGKNTLPIAIGRKRSNKIVFGLTLLPCVLLLYYGQTYLSGLLWALGYGLFFILGPLIYLLIKIWSAKTETDYRHLGNVLKLVIAFTVVFTVVITLNIRQHA